MFLISSVSGGKSIFGIRIGGRPTNAFYINKKTTNQAIVPLQIPESGLSFSYKVTKLQRQAALFLFLFP